MATLDERFTQHNWTITNIHLITAMYAVVEEDVPETRAALYQALLESTLILPVAESLSDSTTPQRQTLDPDESLQLIAYENDVGATVLLAFTDDQAVRLWQPEGTPYIALKARDLFALAARNQIAEVLLNPAGPVSGRILSNEFIPLAQGQLPQVGREASTVLPAERQVLISSPADKPPEAWLETVRVAMAQHPQIVAAYFFQLHLGYEAPRLVIGVHFDAEMPEAQYRSVVDAVSAKAQQPDNFQEQVYYIVLEADEFLQTVSDTVPALYQRAVA